MSQRKYTHIKVLEPEIVKMREAGMCKRAIAEHFGLDTEQVKELLKRYRRRERKIAAGNLCVPKREIISGPCCGAALPQSACCA